MKYFRRIINEIKMPFFFIKFYNENIGGNIFGLIKAAKLLYKPVRQKAIESGDIWK